MRTIVLFMSLVCAACGATAGATVDGSLVGAWQMTGTTMTSSMQKSGAFFMRIEPDGTYALVSSGGPEFVVDAGRFTAASGGGYVRRMATGLEDRGSYERSGTQLRFRSAYGELAGTPARAGDGEPGLTRVATLSRIPPRNHVSQWTARAALVAELWQRDARLEYVSMTGFDARGLLTPDSSVTIGFYSRALDRFLLVSPARNGSGVPVVFTAPRSGQGLGPRGIPLPITDLALLVERQRAAGQPATYAAADLRFVSNGAAPPRLLWMARLQSGAGLDRHCLDVATARAVDCRAVAGDPRAELAALEQRAAAAWRAMQSRLDAGDASSGDFSYVPQTDFERCDGRGGSHNGVGCFASDGSEIR